MRRKRGLHHRPDEGQRHVSAHDARVVDRKTPPQALELSTLRSDEILHPVDVPAVR